MRIAVLGTGPVGRAHAAALANLGHEVTMGTRSPEATLARTTPDAMGTEPLTAWRDRHPAIAVTGFAASAADAELVLNATAGHASLDALHTAGADNLAGKTLIDTAVPNDFTTTIDRPMPTLWGVPAPLLDPVGTDSLAERIQRTFPQAHVVKAVNTMAAHLMTDPGALADGHHTTFLSGDHTGAKQQVAGVLAAYGWSDIVDLGDLTTARATEMLQPLYLALTRALGHEHHGLKVIR